MFRSSNVTPSSPGTKPAAPAKPKSSAFGFLKGLNKAYLPFKEREYFTENLGLLLKSAVPIGEALESLKSSTKNKQLRLVLVQMQGDIEAGSNLADALHRTGIISKQTEALIRLGEASGHLVENLQLAAQQEEKRHIFRSKVRSALIYPSFVLSLTLIVGLGVAWFLLPKLAGTFSQLNVNLPFISRAMINFGIFLKAHGVIAVPLALLVCAVIGYILFAAPRTKHIGQTMLFKMPGIGRLMREVEVAQFGYLLGTLLNAGLSVTQALELLASATTAPQYATLYRHLAASLDQGFGFKESLSHYKNSEKLLPPAVQQMVAAGERSGSLPDVLLTVGRTYEQKADITTSNLEAIIEPILLVIVWVGVMLVAVAVIVPIYSLVGGLQQ
jgi:type IV pilus assembly protein PilC